MEQVFWGVGGWFQWGVGLPLEVGLRGLDERGFKSTARGG